MKCFASLLPALLLSAASASAQTTFRLGLRGGANQALTTLGAGSSADYVNFSSYSTDKSAIYAWQAGLVFEAEFGKFSFQPALLFSQKGDKSKITFYDTYFYTEANDINRYNWL